MSAETNSRPSPSMMVSVTQGVLPLLLALAAGTGCAMHSVFITPSGEQQTVLADDGSRYLALLELRESNRHDELLSTLSHELDRRAQQRDYEGCLHAAGDVVTVSLETGQLDRATDALRTFGQCHRQLPDGQAAQAFVKTVNLKYLDYEEHHPSESASPTIECNRGSCQVRQISDYFSWSRPLEDFVMRGVVGQGTGSAVFMSVIGTVLVFEAASGYRNARREFRGTMRYERPDDAERHLTVLADELIADLSAYPLDAGAEHLHRAAAAAFADVPSASDYRLRVGLAFADFDAVADALGGDNMSLDRVEDMAYFDLVASLAPPATHELAMMLVEPRYHATAERQLTVAAADRYLAHFPTSARAPEISALRTAVLDFEDAIARGPAAVLNFAHDNAGTPLHVKAGEYLDTYVADNVEVLESHIHMAQGDRDWLDDVVEYSKPQGFFGGEKYNLFVFGVYVNRGEIDLPVRLTCDYHMTLTLSARMLFIQNSETESFDKSTHFLAYLPKDEPKVFLCMIKNQQAGGGISAGIMGDIKGEIGFQEPPYTLQASFERRDIPMKVLITQSDLIEDIRKRGNIETKSSPWETERMREVGPNGTMVYYHFEGMPERTGIKFTVVDDATTKRVYRDTVWFNISAFRSPLKRGQYTISLPRPHITCRFEARGDATHVIVNIEDRTCKNSN